MHIIRNTLGNYLIEVNTEELVLLKRAFIDNCSFHSNVYTLKHSYMLFALKIDEALGNLHSNTTGDNI